MLTRHGYRVPMTTPHRVFLLSPAHCGGKRAGYLLNDEAQFPLAKKIRTPGGAPLGEVFAFLSGLYFRGKLAYAAAFASPPAGVGGAYVITSNRGLLSPDTVVTPADLRAFGGVDIDAADARYRDPLVRDATALAAAAAAGPSAEFVLLGSVATGKYVDVLTGVLGDRLRFPADFAGRGDMSRGALMLRRVAAGEELAYVPIAGAARRGTRPPKFERPPAGPSHDERRSDP